MTVNKQPQADTRQVTEQITAAPWRNCRRSLPEDVRLYSELYQQKRFIDLAVENVVEALRDGGILVVIVLFLFLLNFRTTLITLTAIPLSIVITGLVFAGFGLSINTMTLGGLAVAIGELVDDAIVDVENIFRRLKENRHQRQSEAGDPGRLSGQCRDSQFDCVRHADRGAGVHARLCLERHGRPAVHAAWASPTSSRSSLRCWFR